MQESEGQPWQRRMGLRERRILEDARLAVDDLEPLMGRLAPDVADIPASELEAAEAFCAALPPTGGQTGHCQLDFDDLFEVGIGGIAERITRRLDGADADGRIALQSFLDALEGLSAFAEHAGEAAEHAVRQDVPDWRRAELKGMAEACRNISRHPPRTFHEAIQLMWLAELGTMYACAISYAVPGRLDRHLARFYEADISAGRFTPGRALFLIEALYLLVNEYTRDGGAVSVMVGGRNAAGQDATNELSYLALEALRRTRLVYPTVGVCWHEGTPDGLLDLALERIAEGNPNPAIFGDEVIQKGLQAYGVPPAESHEYINSTCVEITPCKSSNVWVASPYFNMCGLLLEEIAARAAAPPADFEEFFGGYFERLGQAISGAVEHQNMLRQRRKQHGGKPLQSIFTRDCIERKRDIDDGGARYNWVECSFVGLANLADSLHVLREDVFLGGRLTLRQLKSMLDLNYDGCEAERARLLNRHPKYGQGDERVDELFGRAVAIAAEHCRRHRMSPGGSPFVPGAFAFTRHEAFGRETGATPDGRPVGTPFADGCGPAQGREKRGPTAAILSTTSWDHSPMIGGLAFNMKFNGDLAQSPGGVARLKDLVLTYLRRGGFETQINVVNRELLAKARANPEPYRDLVVRIGGYTDYFARLSPEMQDEILRRTEYEP